ncbi:hypothetical protein L1987_07946 [Smallanthus sonchifolius]|uniref:Uncharacterized protein n=1 Tax=Smallanthus sonchifolius TaxID=185202 RepID=A0ACB9JLI5_9ASTR|nr:hypothetical protein L1987_07946 [Smallanthus sonchifolius]
MDREQEEMQFVGLFGIFKESYKIIISWRKIFTQITLTLILPLTFIFLAHLEISNSLFVDIEHTEYEKRFTRPGTKRYTNLSNTLSSEWITFWLFKVAYFTALLILSLLSTAAVVYTIASIYTGRKLTFKNVMSVVPKVWKRLMATFVYMFLAFLVYNLLGAFVLLICFMILPDNTFGAFLANVLLVIYVMGFVYMTVIWQLASVVSVLESVYGMKAMTKSMDLIKGNRGIAISIFFLLNMSFILIQILFESLVMEGSLLDAWKRVGFGVLYFILLLTLFLFGLVIQTILYLVCKSYHHENIDKEDLSNHLESYLGDYEPLNGKDVQLQQYHV